MSRRSQLARRVRTLEEIGNIFGAMKNLSLMETMKLARFSELQHRVLAGIKAAAVDFLAHDEVRAEGSGRPRDAASIVVALGSQRGFCGNFNVAVQRRIEAVLKRGNDPALIVVGRRLAAKFGDGHPIAEVLDGASMVEEVQPVLERLTNLITRLADRSPEGSGIRIVAHCDDGSLHEQDLWPPDGEGTACAAYPPRLTLPPEEFRMQLLRHYLWAVMHDLYFSSLAAEHRCRLQHMQTALKRIDEQLEILRRRGQALRQTEITEEIEGILLSGETLGRSDMFLRARVQSGGRAT